jgi:SsrA-binding protein
MKILAKNKKALANYELIDKLEAGIVLKGWEVKSIRSGNVNLKDSYVKIINNEPWLYEVNVSRWKTQSKHEQIDTRRPRKLLLNKRQIERVDKQLKTKGITLIPITLYLSNNKIKTEIALARGMKKYDKKQQKKERDMKRELEIDLKSAKYF